MGQSMTKFHATGTQGMTFDGTTADLLLSDNGKVFRITVPLANLKTGSDLRDRHMLTALEVATYPSTLLTVVRSDLKFPPAGGTVSATISGTYSLHGVSVRKTVNYTATTEGDHMRIVATFPVDMTAHAIPQPAYLGVRVDKDVQVTVNFAVK